MVKAIIETEALSKTYSGGFKALEDINLQIYSGEIFALLGPNGAGKTTLISIICGIANKTSGSVLVDGFDNVGEFRKTRDKIGLVPQELTTDAFETVWNTVNFSRGLFGKSKNYDHIESVLRSLTLWEQKDKKLMMLSGGMKRRVMIAKALAHEPEILFLDEPSAGVDVELRKDMWNQVRSLRDSGVTIILTTHYIEEAEEMADRVGVINRGKLIHVEKKSELMKNLGTKQLILELDKTKNELPQSLNSWGLQLHGQELTYQYDPKKQEKSIMNLFADLQSAGLTWRDIRTKNSSLEEIFVELVK